MIVEGSGNYELGAKHIGITLGAKHIGITLGF